MKRPSGTLATLVMALLLPLGANAADAEPAKAKKLDPPCESSASRVRKSKAGVCPKDSQPTRTYTKEDLDSTGQTDVGEALRRLDPRFH